MLELAMIIASAWVAGTMFSVAEREKHWYFWLVVTLAIFVAIGVHFL